MKHLPLSALLLSALLAACGVESPGEGPSDSVCTVHLTPGSDDHGAIQSALIGAFPGSVICLDQGTYHLTDSLVVSVPAVSIRATDGPVILDFAGQVVEAPGIDVTGDDVAIDGLVLRNTAGDALRLVQVDNVKVRRLQIDWGKDAPPVADAQGIAILGASNVIVEACEIQGATGNGVLVSSSLGVIVRSTSVVEAGGGIVVESSSDVQQVNNRLRDISAPIDVEEGAAEDEEASDDGLNELPSQPRSPAQQTP